MGSFSYEDGEDGITRRIANVREDVSPRAVGYRHHEDHEDGSGHLVAYVFGPTAQRVVDLIGFAVETSPSAEASSSRATSIAEHAAPDIPARGLRSQAVRAAVTQQGLLEQAREQLARVLDEWRAMGSAMFPPDVPVRRGGRDGLTDDFLAGFVLRYSAALAGGLIRKQVAEAEGCSPKTIENWVDKARVRGFWETSGRGKPGQPTQRARELAGGDDR